MSRARDATGQASVELVGVLPLAVLVAAALWQAVVAGEAIWSAAGAARSAARAQAVGGDPLASARGRVPGSLRRGVRVRAEDGGVRVGVAIPLVLTGRRLATVTARASLPAQR